MARRLSWTLGIAIATGFLLGGMPAQGGIIIADAESQPVGDPQYDIFYQFALTPGATLNQYDSITVYDLQIIGDQSSNFAGFFYPVATWTISFNKVGISGTPIAGAGLPYDDPNIFNLSFIYTGAAPITNPSPTENMLLGPLQTFGFRTIDFGPLTTPAIAALLQAPSPTVNAPTSGGFPSGDGSDSGPVSATFVGPISVPEPTTVGLAASALAITLIARLRRRSQAA